MKARRFPSYLLAVGIWLMLAGCAAKQLTVHEGWSRPALAGGSGAIYFTIDNPLNTADTLLGVSSDAAESVEMHSTIIENNVASMQAQATVPVPAQSAVKFEPGGLHVMLMNMKKDLKPGDTFNATLSFDRAGPITISVTVKEP